MNEVLKLPYSVIDSKFDLTTPQSNFFLFLLKQYDLQKRSDYNDNSEVKKVIIKKEDYKLFVGKKTFQTTNGIRKFLYELRNKPFITDSEKEIFCGGFIGDFKVIKECETIEINMSSSVLFHMHSLYKNTNYTYLGLNEVFSLETNYSFKFYMLFKKNDFRGEFSIPLDDLREYLNLNGDKAKYPDYFMMKKRVIQVAVNELIEKKIFDVEFEEIKSGKAVTGIKFKIKYLNRQKEKDILNNKKLKGTVPTITEDDFKKGEELLKDLYNN